MTLELCYLSASEALALFRQKKLSPVELMQAIIARAEAVEPTINAFSYTYFEQALTQAKAAEDAYRRGTARPLTGIPVAIKDESYIAGQPTSNGALSMQTFVPDATSVAIERILDAGAIVHARTTTPEFSTAVFTWSRLWGVTRNPWNTAVTPGGSTGGGAAALAAGTTTLINGSDIAGSIRVPASMCGVVGYKPPFGRNPEEAPWNAEPYTHNGPLARTLDDTILLQNIMAGPHPRDMTALKPKLTLPTQYGDIRGWRIAYSPDLGYKAIDPEVTALMQDVVAAFEAAGAIVEEVDLGWTAETTKAALDHTGYGLSGGFLRQAYAEHGDSLTSYNRWLAEYAMQITPLDYRQAELLAGQMFNQLSDLFQSYRLLLCPTVATLTIPADFDYARDELVINGRSVHPKLGWVLTYPFNMLNRCPVLALPAGRGRNNVPLGFQLVAPPFEDALAFQAGAAYEKAVRPLPFLTPDNLPALRI